MSLHKLASHVQKHGRGEDTVLIHMTPGEVNGLQTIALRHGGSLTINPKTGLPEAGFLKSILPMLAGAGLMMTGVGAPLAALMVGAGGGLYEGLKTGSVKKGIMGALGSGLGAYGGASLAGGLGRMGATAAAAEGAAARGAGGALGPVSAEGQAAANALRAPTTGAPAFGSAIPPSPLTPGAAGGAPFSGANPSALNFQRASQLSTGVPSGAPQVASTLEPTSFEAMKRGASTAWDNPAAYKDALGGWGGTAMAGGAAMAPFLLNSEASANARMPAGGQLSPAMRTKLAKDYYQRPYYSGQEVPLTGTMYAGGGHVDGMSDSIPAQMPNGQAARLSHDEFVVPADVVSSLGNGSSQSGAERLYAMMDRVRRERTGNAAPPARINPKAVMPR